MLATAPTGLCALDCSQSSPLAPVRNWVTYRSFPLWKGKLLQIGGAPDDKALPVL
jgi:hypothetical protein